MVKKTGQIDLLLVAPDGKSQIYQSLANALASAQPPVWAGMLASFVRRKGFSVEVLDADAAGETSEQVAAHIAECGPRLAAVICYGAQPSASTQVMPSALAIARAAQQRLPATSVVMVGGHVAALSARTARESGADFVCTGSGEHSLLDLLEGKQREDCRGIGYMTNGWATMPSGCAQGQWYFETKPAPAVADLDAEMPDSAPDLMGPMSRYRCHNWHGWTSTSGAREPYGCIYTSLSCPYTCLRGDAQVNTLYGKKSIKSLVGKKAFPVYVYDQESKDVRIETAVAIRRYGVDKSMVRVRFDDGTYIDCTPDHRFIQIKVSGGRGPKVSREEEVRADNLSPGTSVRALREERTKTGRVYINWARRSRDLRARMVMEYVLGRELETGELVHHKNHDQSNDHPDNLEVLSSRKEHAARHPEMAARMRDDNPVKNMTPEWQAKITAANKGKVRTLKSRRRYRESKLGRKNPNYKHGDRVGTKSRVREVNHRVVSVECLENRDDVYCLTVSTGWFFVNDVAVHNCEFCCIRAPFAAAPGAKSNGWRCWRPETKVAEIIDLVERHGCTNVKIADELFVLNKAHVEGICDGLTARGLGKVLNIWAYGHVNTLKDSKLLVRLRNAGFRWLAIGIESASEQVRADSAKRFSDADLRRAVKNCQDAGIDVLANYIVGLPGDDDNTCQATLDQAKDLKPGWLNIYSAMPYPGSKLYADTARDHPEHLPPSWSAYSQHSYDCQPLPTEKLSAAEVLAWRDRIFHSFFEDHGYLASIEGRYGRTARAEVEDMTKIRLKRKLLEGAVPHAQARVAQAAV